MNMSSSNTGEQQQTGESRCRKKCREYAAAAFFLPVMFFCFDLSNKNWVDSSTGTSEGFHLEWSHSTYFVIASICGAIGGSIASLYPGRVEKEWIAGLLAGFIASPLALGLAVVYLDQVTSSNTVILLLIALIGGGIPYGCIYLGVKKHFLKSAKNGDYAQFVTTQDDVELKESSTTAVIV